MGLASTLAMALKPRSQEPSKARSASHGRSLEKGKASQRSQSRGEEKAKPVELVPSSYFTWVCSMRAACGCGSEGGEDDPLPTAFTSPTVQGDCPKWMLRDLTRLWGEGGRAWFNVYVGLYLYEPDDQRSVCHPRFRCLLDLPRPSSFTGSFLLLVLPSRTSSNQGGQKWGPFLLALVQEPLFASDADLAKGSWQPEVLPKCPCLQILRD